MAHQADLQQSTQTKDSKPNSSQTMASKTNSDNAAEYTEFGELTPYMTEQETVFFRGLDDHTQTDYPDPITGTSRSTQDPLCFTEVIKQLPHAEKGTLQAVNPFINDDGSVPSDLFDDADIDTDELSVDISDVNNAEKNIPLNDYKVIIDPLRARLNALDPRIKFWWNVTTDGSGRSYTIINPKDAYWPAYRTLKNNGKDETVFGWVEKRDYGGDIDMFILFDDHTIPHPTEDDAEIYIGFQTGYNFTSSRAFDVSLFGYDPVNDVRLYSLGERRSRRHVGDPDDAEAEREQGRTPISEWWDEEYDNLLLWTDDLIDDIQRATETTIDFTTFDFGIEEFYKYLDIPQSYIENTDGGIGAVKRAKQHSPSNTVYTMWSLYYGLSTTLEKEFQGNNHSGTTYKIHADIATNILRTPHRTILKAKRAHQEEISDESTTENDATELITSDEDVENQDITDIDGVDTEDKLNLAKKRDIATEKQKELFDEYKD